MNKKIYAGLLSFGVAATFWACGSGDIIKADHNGGDDIMKVWPIEDPEHADPGVTVGINADVVTKESCPECFIGGTTPSSSSARPPRPPRSSSSIFTPFTSSPSVSSSSTEPINLNSSSSRIWIPPSSSSEYIPPIVSSSSAPVTPPVGDAGSCAPVKAIVEQGEPVIWKYTVSNGGVVKTTDMLSAQLKWSTPGGSPEVLEGKGAKFMSDTVNYATSGPHTASLVLGTTKGTFNITCSPVQVNGAKITGCKCSTEASKSVDFTKTPNVEWSVTGCTTGAELELSYEWDGAPGKEKFTKTFTAAAEKYSPKLFAKNNDNTMIEVECPSIKITDGPEFEITTTQGAGAIKLPKGTSSVVLSVDAYNNTVFCNVSRDDSPSGALNGTVNKTAIKGSDYIAVSMPAGTLVKGATLEFTLDVPATCGVQ